MSLLMIRKLTVRRCLSDGHIVNVGQLAQNKTGVYFQYDVRYLNKHPSLSPFNLPFDQSVNLAPLQPHLGLHGVFADSLPDGWGLLIMDKLFLQNGIDRTHISPMDRLSFMGNNTMGALSYSPQSGFARHDAEQLVKLNQLGANAVALFDGDVDKVLEQIAAIGSPGGARPKAQIYIDPIDSSQISTQPRNRFIPSIIKFTSSNLLLDHEEGLCEAAYLTIAKKCGIDVPNWHITQTSIANKPMRWLTMERYDCKLNNRLYGRFHTHSLSGLLNADFRQPSLDYEDVIRAGQALCRSPAVGKELFKRAIFNLYALNQDDHAKNWEFIQDDDGSWRIAPFFDVTFSPTRHNEHSTSYVGYGKNPPVKSIQKLAKLASYKNWHEAVLDIQEVVENISKWDTVAKEMKVKKETRLMITKQLNQTFLANKALLLK